MTIYATGVDYSNPATPPRVLAAHGATFACRYASTPGNPKNLTRDEAAALAASGISIVSVFETTAGRALAGRTAGHDDALSAVAQHGALGLPNDRPIYFAVDFDMQSSQEPAVTDYFLGVDDAIGAHRAGVYGGLRASEFIYGNELAAFVWQTYAWSGGTWALATHLRQVHNGMMWDGWAVDLDEAWASDYGAWRPGNAPTPTPTPPPANWTHNMITSMPTIQNGSHDPIGDTDYVHRAQALVNVQHFAPGLVVDGAFGPHTEAAMRQLQSNVGLVVDGIVGPHTWSVLVTGRDL